MSNLYRKDEDKLAIRIGKSKVRVGTFKKWMKALRSGKYKQIKERLQSQYGYCCLGVACELFIKESKKERKAETGFLLGFCPDDQPNAPKWLQYINEDFYLKTGEEITVLNDEKGLTFSELADELEKVYLNGIYYDG